MTDKLQIQWPAKLDAANIEQAVQTLEDALKRIRQDTVTLTLRPGGLNSGIKGNSFIVPRKGPFSLLALNDVLLVTDIQYGPENSDDGK